LNNHLFATIPARIVGMKTPKDLHTRVHAIGPTKIVSKKSHIIFPSGGCAPPQEKEVEATNEPGKNARDAFLGSQRRPLRAEQPKS
jgi:hypothetical protein